MQALFLPGKYIASKSQTFFTHQHLQRSCWYASLTAGTPTTKK